jgi:hypothetical protein
MLMPSLHPVLSHWSKKGSHQLFSMGSRASDKQGVVRSMDLKGAKYLEKLVLYFLAVRRLRNWGRPPQIPSGLQGVAAQKELCWP